MQTDKKGNAKTRMDKIEKGILSEGANFKNEDNVIEVGGEGNPSVFGVEHFALKLSKMVGKEIAGTYFSKNGSSETTHITIGSYKNNSYTKHIGFGNNAIRSVTNTMAEFNSYKATGLFHTHPWGNVPSIPDKEIRDKEHERNPNLKFFILINEVLYNGKEPYKHDYTTE